jgi:iron complex outermembrane receptor protein
VDVYTTDFDEDYASYTDPSGETTYFAAGRSRSKGIEAEGTLAVGGGLFLYTNATAGSSKYIDSGLWKQNTPKDTETLGVTFINSNLSLGFFAKRIGTMYNDSGSLHQAFKMDPVTMANLFVNYTLRGSSLLGRSKLKFGINNLFDVYAVTAISGATKNSSLTSPNDVLTVTSGRSVSLTLTVDLSRK